MHITLITTAPDQASMNLRNHLLDQLDWQDDTCSIGEHTVVLKYFETESIHLEHVDKDWDTDIIVFCSKHQSKSGIPSFSVHPIGNFSVAEYGGEDNYLCPCTAELMYHCYHALYDRQQKSDLPHEVVYEATHHGPALVTPTLFIEIGSNAEAWQDPVAGKLVVSALIEGISKLGTVKDLPPIGIGIGGLHTCHNFNKLVQRKQIMLGHVCPVYMLEHISAQKVDDMLAKSRAELVVLDWKGLKAWKEQVREAVVDKLVKRTNEFS